MRMNFDAAARWSSRLFPVTLAFAAACSETPECPAGQMRVASRCRVIDMVGANAGSNDGENNGAANGEADAGTNGGGTNGGSNGEANGGNSSSECSEELCNGLDDDCDTLVDEDCADTDDCASLPCKNGGTCKDGDGTFECACPPGFSGPTCEVNADDCSPNPCLNGGVCADGANTVTCSCAPGYQGERCEIANNDCDPNPCRNGGTCADKTGGGYTCTCAPGYGGMQCETNTDECNPNPCLNGGVCTDALNDFMCTCPPGFSGRKCETNINDCSPNPCLNGGVCVDRTNDYECTCKAGYQGDRCEINNNDCDPNPCRNDGECTEGVGVPPTCKCKPGYTGAQCETNINECAPNPCVHGTCTDLINDFKCTCEAGWKDKKCDADIDDCTPNPCQNGGTCTDGGPNKAICTCPAGTSGTRCEAKVCGSLDIKSQADIDANKFCSEVQGDLGIGRWGFASIKPSDFPYLKKVTGRVHIAKPLGGGAIAVDSVTLGALETIGGQLYLDERSVSLSMPALKVLGDGTTGINGAIARVRSLLVPSLTTINGDVSIPTSTFCAADFSSLTVVTGDVSVFAPYLPTEDIAELIAASPLSSTSSTYGCCDSAPSAGCSSNDRLDPANPLCVCQP